MLATWVKTLYEDHFVPADVAFVARFPWNRRFLNEIVEYQELFSGVNNATSELEQPRRWRREGEPYRCLVFSSISNIIFIFWGKCDGMPPMNSQLNKKESEERIF